MQDSIELPSSEDQQRNFQTSQQNNTTNKYDKSIQQQLQLQTEKPLQPSFNDIISPKGRKLTKFSNQYKNTNSQQSLAYSNSTYNKWTERAQLQKERSPSGTGMFSNGTHQNGEFDQNINTLNFLKSSQKKKASHELFSSTHKDNMRIEFSKIYQEQSGLQQQEDGYQGQQYGRSAQHSSKIQNRALYLPNFKSENPSPNKFQASNNKERNDEDEHNIEQSSSQSQRFNQKTQEDKKHNLKKKDANKISNNKSHSKNKETTNPSLHSNKSRNVEPNSKTIKSLLDKSHNISERSNSNNSKKSHSNSKNKQQVKETLAHSNFNTKQNSIHSYRQKIKELEYALNVQSIVSEELRTKVNVLNELLEEKFLQKNGINMKLFFNNQKNGNNSSGQGNQHTRHRSSEQTQKPIQLYVQMRILQKRNNELQILNQRFKDTLKEKQTQIKALSVELSEFHNKKTNSNTQTPFQNHNKSQLNNRGNVNYDVNANQATSANNPLCSSPSPNGKSFTPEQKETLLQYIDNQQQQLNEKSSYIRQIQGQCQHFTQQLLQLKNHIKLLQEKQRRFSDEQRPKLFAQIKELSNQLNCKKEENQRLQMENNLIKMTNEQLNNGGTMSLSKYNLTSRDNSATSSPYKSIGRNTERKEGLYHNNNQSNEDKNNEMEKENQYHHHNRNAHQNGNNNNMDGQSQSNQSQSKQLKVIKDPSKDLLSLTLLQQEELSLLKKQRDHFMTEFQNMKIVSNENYQLRLSNQQLVKELKEYRLIMDGFTDSQHYQQ